MIHFNYRILVRLGELDASEENVCANGLAVCSEPQDYQIEMVIPHSGYDTPKYSNDIALIRLLLPANSSKGFFFYFFFSIIYTRKSYIAFVSPLCLPIGPYAGADQNVIGSNGIIAGWGAMSPGKYVETFCF